LVALGLGLLSVAVLCLPFIGYGSLLLSGVELLLGLWALFYALRRGAGEERLARGACTAAVGGRGLTYPLAGTLACLAALFLALLPFLLDGR
jgi:hypothetical protein